MARYPGAAWKPVCNYTNTHIEHLGLILHVAAANGGLHDWFNRSSTSASAHFWVSKDGHVEQYVDSDLKAWAQAAGNSTYNSVETEGYPGEPLTTAQVEALAHLYAWGHKTHGWPLQVANEVGAHGFGWHGMGGSAWGGHTACPGDLRKAQRSKILDRAHQLLGVTTPQPAHTASVLQRGDTGAAVRAWQVTLNSHFHCRLVADGDFGAATEAATKQVQKSPLKVAVTGKVDATTRKAVDAWLHAQLPVLRVGSRGPLVKEVQHAVGATVDGIFGSGTESKVKTFQSHHGLPADGIVGAKTWAVIR